MKEKGHMHTSNHSRDFPGSPVVKTSPSSARAPGSIPGHGAKVPYALWGGPPKKIVIIVIRILPLYNTLGLIMIYRIIKYFMIKFEHSILVKEKNGRSCAILYKGSNSCLH